MASATAITVALTPKVKRIPAASSAGCELPMPFVVEAARANTAPRTDAPVISPRFRDRLSMPEITPR